MAVKRDRRIILLLDFEIKTFLDGTDELQF